MPRRIVVNKCFGGFCLSKEAKDMYHTLTKDVERSPIWSIDLDVARDDPHLLTVVDTLGLNVASGSLANLAIVEIPDDIPDGGWTIEEYDGNEWVAEKHQKWHPA